MSTELDDLIRRVERLSHQDRLRLVEHLSRKVSPETAGLPWREICSTAPYLLLGEDALAWESRTRREGDEQRQNHLRNCS
jgi:hypothetical protein